MRFSASWILPISAPPIRGGCVSVGGDRILAVDSGPADPAVDLGRVAVLPALVNAHTHLELSHLAGRIPPSQAFGEWVQRVLALRREYPDPTAEEIVDAARRAIDAIRASGTGLVGDISNTLVACSLLEAAGMPARVFYELTGFAEPDPAGRVQRARGDAAGAARAGGCVRVDVAPHAPYSVSAGLFAAIRSDLDAHPRAVSTVHVAENPEEAALLRDGTGPIRTVLEQLGRWPSGWRPPGVSAVAYLCDLGFFDARVLAVHGVLCDADDLGRLRDRGVTLVSCPRSNVYVGAGSPPLETFYDAGVQVAFGTDSLASVADLNLFAELAEARRIAPHVPARRLLQSATLGGARALGFEDDYGSLEPGKRAALIGVRVPEGVADVEEFLVSGVDADGVFWVQ